MKIKVGDNVKILAGKDTGKTGKVTQVLPREHQVVVEGLNVRTKHLRPQRQGEKGQRLAFNAPVNSSNVQVVCPKCSNITRVGYKILEDGKKERQCRKCGEQL